MPCCPGASAGAATRGATARELPPAGRGRVASSWRRMDAGADVDMEKNYINRDKHVHKLTKSTPTKLDSLPRSRKLVSQKMCKGQCHGDKDCCKVKQANLNVLLI